MIKDIIIATLLALLLVLAIVALVGCGSDLRAMPAVKGQPVEYDSIILSLEQYVEAGETSPLNGIALSGNWIDDLVSQLPPNFEDMSKSKRRRMIKDLVSE